MRTFNRLLFMSLLWTNTTCALPPLTGPLLPRPSNLQGMKSFNNAMQNITDLLELTTSEISPLRDFFRNVSFSIAITSYAAPEQNPVLWEYHHLAPERNENATSTISGSSQYLIASITKVFTDLLVLKSDIDLNAPVTEYIPELKRARNHIAWHKITIYDLMSHISGIPQNYGFPEIYQLVPLYQQLRFPPVPESDFPTCGVIGLNSGCDAAQLVEGLTSSRPGAVANPGYTAAYNNLAFAILGIVLERRTNHTFADMIHSQITKPLGMINSGISPGNTTAAVIPTGESSWGSDFGINAPQGGMFSSTDDLSRFARAILAHSELILFDPADIDRWLKPNALLPGRDQFVGAPWEIYRTPRLIQNQTVDIYTKDGGVVGYASRLALSPQFGVGITCLTAGSVSGPDLITESVLTVLMPALNEVANEQASKYAGVWHTVNSTVDANMTTSIDSSGLGMHISHLFRNGSDVLAAIGVIYAAGPVVAGRLDEDWTAFPTNLRYESMISDPAGEQISVILEEWRLSFETTRFRPDANTELGHYNQGVFENSISSWQGLDSMYYGGRAVDRIIAVISQDGERVIGWQVPSLRVDLWKN